MGFVLKKIVIGYQIIFAPFLGGRCRFYPSCSQYALQAFDKYPWWKTLYLIMRRVLRCHPFGGSGVDLVP